MFPRPEWVITCHHQSHVHRNNPRDAPADNPGVLGVLHDIFGRCTIGLDFMELRHEDRGSAGEAMLISADEPRDGDARRGLRPG